MLTPPLNTDLALTKSAKKKNSTFVLTLVAAAVLSGFSATSMATPPRHADFSKAEAINTINRSEDFTSGSFVSSETTRGGQKLDASMGENTPIHGSVLVRVQGSDAGRVDVSASNLNLSHTISRLPGENGENYSLAGGTIYVGDLGSLTLSGTNTIALNIENGRTYTDGGAFNAAIEASSLTIDGGTTTVTANADSAGSPSLSGINVTGDLHLTNNATLMVNVKTGAIADPDSLLVMNGNDDYPYEMQGEGIVLQEGATLRTDAGTTLEVNIESTGESPVAAFATALTIGDGSVLNGTTIARASDNGSYSIDIDVEGSASFNGKTIVEVSSKGRDALGIDLGSNVYGQPDTINFGELSVTAQSSNGPVYGAEVEDMVTVNFRDNTEIKAVFTNPNVGVDVTGLAAYDRSTVNFIGKNISISSESASNVYPGQWPQWTVGIDKFGPGTITSSADTDLTISAVNTGAGTVIDDGQNNGIDENNFAGVVIGLNAEGGTIDLQGKTTITATGKGAYAQGMTLQALAGDSEDGWSNIPADELKFDLNATFGGDLTVTATSETGGAEAIRLGGFVPADEDEGPGLGVGEYPEGVKVTMNTSETGVTRITASTGSSTFESVGVQFVHGAEVDDSVERPDIDTATGYLNLNGETHITATHALKGDVGYVNNKGDLTLNGRVDQFKGEFTQTAGSTTLNDSRFFGGRTTIEGGAFTGQTTVWDSEVASSLTVSNASISLHTFNVGQNHELSLSNATVTANYFNLNDQAQLDVGGSSFVLNGTDDEDSRIGGTMTGIKDITVNGGTLDLVEDARLEFVDGGKMTFNNGAMFSVAGNVSGGDLIFNDGTYLYEARPENEKELRIESGNVTFNGNVALLTGVSEDGSDMTLDNADRMTSLAIGPNNSSDGEPDPNVVFDGGSYTFETASVHAGALTFTGDAGNVDLGTLSITAGVTNVSGGNVYADKIDVSGSGKLAVNGGSLHTYTDQIFEAGVGEDGQKVNPEGVKNGIELTKGTVAFEDQFYNEFYKNNAITLAKDGVSVVFNGERVGLNGGTISIDDVGDQEGVTESQVDVSIDKNQGADASIGNSFGVSSIKVDSGVKSVTIGGDADGATVTLVGGTDEQGNLKEVIDFADEGGSVKIDNKGTLALGKDGSVNNEGKLSSAVTVGDSGTLAVNSGTFTVSNATVDAGGTVAVAGGEATFEKLQTSGGTIDVTGGSASIGNMNLGAGNTTILGKVTVDKIQVGNQKEDSVVNIGTAGNDGRAGKLTITSDSLGGAMYFLDPAYGNGIEQGSSLKFAGKNIDGKLIAGQNSYLVLGSTDDSELLKLFAENDSLTWGGNDGEIGAAVYVGAPITVDASGYIYADADLTSIDNLGQIAGGSVYFDSNSALVANVSNAEDGKAMITVGEGASVTVNDGSKAILVGDIRQDITYKLINNNQANQVWDKNLMAGNGMWDLKMDENGNIKANLQDARQVYGDSMQGADLANAGILGSEAERKYVNDVLTDTSGNLAAAAARFDAAMNPAGALTAFTTAYDRASDLRRIVREESVKGEGNRLWAQVTGGKTKLDGISSGAQSIKTDTNVYGLAIGGEAQFTNFMLGAAITAGTGKTENDAVDGTDDFEYYGFSLYGKTSVAGFDLLGDVSATWLKSDFTIGGAADVDTDTTTAVYSFGVQGEKKFEMSWADFTPFIGVDVYHVRSDGFDNSHGAKIDDSDATAVEIPIGARLSKSLETTGGFHMEPSFMLAVVPTIADTEIDSKVRFAGAESTYNFTFADDVKIRSNIGLDAVKDNFTFGLRAGYEWGDEERSAMNLQLRAKYAF